MPILRPFNRPRIWKFGEAVEFIRQVFEVGAFMSFADQCQQHIMFSRNPIYA
jgi:hypothetical protein